MEPFARIRRHLLGSVQLREKVPNSSRPCTLPLPSQCGVEACERLEIAKSNWQKTTVAQREALVALSIALREWPRLVSLAEWMQLIGAMPSTLRCPACQNAPPLTYRSRQLGSLASPSPPRGIGAGGETCLARGPRPRVNIAALPCAARAIQLTYSVLLTSYHEWNFGIRIEGG